MSGPSAQCPSCGAEVGFRWAGAVQTTCDYCDSILVRHGTDLEKVGKVSEPPPTTSPIQLGTEGRYDGRPFTVVGRIVYGYERGGWSEWHLVFDDGSSGWLSDAMLEYSVSFLAEDAGPIPYEDQIARGLRLKLLDDTYEVTDTTPARYLSTEGELPWEYHDRDDMTFADLKSGDGKVVTLDYSEDPPLVFAGEYVHFDDLALTHLREDTGDTLHHSQVQTLSCPNCGSSVEVRQAGLSVNVVCASCASVLDATSPGAKVLQTFKKNKYIDPRIPLGTKGSWKGAEYEVLGYQFRTMHWPGEKYSWDEYLIYNPEYGFRYLTEEDGHWNDAVTVKEAPDEGSKYSAFRRKVHFRGETYKHFEGARTTTDYVLGEWPWEVRVGDEVHTDDFVCPPRSLSKEVSDDETVWSVAEYVDGHRIWEAFDLEGKPPRPVGVYSNQPSPHADRAKRVGLTAAFVVPLFLVLWIVRTVTGSTPITAEAFQYTPPADSAVQIVGPFTVGGRTANLALEARTDVSNNWIYFDYALVNTATGEVREAGREVGYYFGREGGESWREGSQRGQVTMPSVPSGEYMLRVAPEGPVPVQYTIRVLRDAPVHSLWLVTFLILLLPPISALMRQASFHSRRMAESDYASD
ncbi:MAG: DUF4178 domain-containing protein [Gemmatimonadetes bacterium]|nr:DUF4178 domain-containing protein [Gemmatimonadota bacterium]